MWKQTVLLAACIGLSTSAMAINKCTGADGRVVFQDAPCAEGRGGQIDVKPASGRASMSMAPLTAASAPQTEAQRMNASVAASQNERRKLSLERRGVPDASDAVFSHRSACQAEQARLEAEKHKWQQNMWGKTNSAQMASEQAAAASRCDTKDRELVNNYNQALKECKDLGGCASARSM